MRPTFRVSLRRDDTWDLYEKAEEDQRRHERRLREALKHNLVDLIDDESIVISDGQRVVRVPMEGLAEPRFRFAEGVGGAGQEAGAEAGHGPTVGAPDGHRGGDRPGLEDVRDATIRLEDADRLVFEGLTLPDWDPARKHAGHPGGDGLMSLERVGLAAHLSPRDTLKAALRHRRAGERLKLMPEDLRYRQFRPDPVEEAGAVVLAMMDTSGSMGTFEKYLARSFFFWAVRFLRTAYPRVTLVFLAHDVRAREVDEDTFFHRGASGGTVSSSVYRLGREVLEARFPADRFNAYAFHFTDGGNLTSDNGQALAEGEALARRVNLFGYGEIHDTARNPSPLFTGFAGQPHTRAVVLRGKEDVMTALRTFFAPDHAREPSA
jgi:sporulation protein YhbH